MKKLLALVLALLLILPTVLTACTVSPKETDSESKTEVTTREPQDTSKETDRESGKDPSGDTSSENDSGNASETDSESEPVPPLPTVKDGKVLKLKYAIPIPGTVEMESVKYWNTLFLDYEFNTENNTLNIVATANYKGETGDKRYIANLYFDGDCLYAFVQDVSADEVEKQLVTVDYIINQILTQMEIDPDSVAAQYIKTVIKNLLKSNVRDLVGTVDPSALLNLLPEEIRDLLNRIGTILPEVELPEEPEVDTTADAVLFHSVFEKTELPDGGYEYVFDFNRVIVPVMTLIGTVEGLMDATPAQLIDMVAGEGTFDRYFKLFADSVKGDTQIGTLLDMAIVWLNGYGFRITDEKVVSLIVSAAKVSGAPMTEEQAQECYQDFRSITLDQLILMIPGAADGSVRVDDITAQIKSLLAETKLSAIIDRLTNAGASASIAAILAEVKGVLELTAGGIKLTADENDEIYRIAFVLTYDEKTFASSELTFADSTELPVPEIPNIDEIKVSRNEAGDIIFSGMPEGATLNISVFGTATILQHYMYGDVYFNWYQDEDWNRYVTVDGSTFTVSGGILEMAFDKYGRIPEDGYRDYDTEGVLAYQITVTIKVELADGTVCTVFPTLVESWSFNN